MRGGSSLIAFVLGGAGWKAGYAVVGAHTDSPGLRLKPRAAHAADGLSAWRRGLWRPHLATFADRDLSLAGRVSVRQDGRHPPPAFRAAPGPPPPTWPSHRNREVNRQGLKFNKQTELPLLFGAAAQDGRCRRGFSPAPRRRLAVESGDVLTWELSAYDTQRAG